MKKSELIVLPVFFDRYIHLVEDIELNEALKEYVNFSENDLVTIKALKNLVYEEGKWTMNDILQHIIDNERIQSYRALRIARNDKTALPGYDENYLGKYSEANSRSVDDLIEEFNIVRAATISLFRSFNQEMLQRTGISNGLELTPLALGFVIVGHQIHHLRIINEKYKPLLLNQ